MERVIQNQGWIYLGYAAGLAFAAEFGLWPVCRWTASLRPDPASGRIYAIQQQGTIYVTRALGLTYDGVLAVGLALFAASVVLYFVHGKRGS